MSDAPAAAERGTVRVRANCARRPPETAEEAAWALDLDAGLSSARETLVRCQVTKDGDPADGGFSAAPPGAPDLRTTSQAARALGAFPGAPRAIAFVTRCQRPTGGFAGNPGVAHPDPASTCDALIALRGFGVPADDERVKNALLWLRANAPPGFSFRFLASLAAVWQDLGGPPGWRETLSARLLSRQRADGSWVNDGEEMGEFREVVRAGNTRRVEDELGDILFTLANVARKLDIDPESALRRTNEKFVRRFKYVEKTLRAQGKAPETATLDEMEALWQEAKGTDPK